MLFSKIRIFYQQISNSGYLFYGFSTLLSRGLEYLMLITAASLMLKSEYGAFEFYKKTIELCAIAVAFGTPTLLLTYTKGKFDKINLTLVSLCFSMVLSLFIWPLFYWLNMSFLVMPILFFAMFFYANSIIQSFNVVAIGSKYSAWYKLIGSFLFNGLLIALLFWSEEKSKTIVLAANICLIVFMAFYVVKFFTYFKQGSLSHLKKYVKIFTGLLYSTFTLVFNNFINIAFLYTDIYMIKYLADNELENQLIGEYAFPLNIANALMIIPMTIAHVDIEAVKKNTSVFDKVLKNNKKLLLLGVVCMPILYAIVLFVTQGKYENTWMVFFILLITKWVQSLGVPYGMMVVLQKRFNDNVKINVGSFFLNVTLGFILFPKFGILGIAIASFISLTARYLVLRRYVKSILSNL